MAQPTIAGNLKGKRKKAVPKNANPLFTKWITEWKEEAVLKGWKSQYNYSKALKTLKMFPLRLESGKDCRMLQNFGDKICKMLDEKLVEHRMHQEKGLVDEDDCDGSLSETPVSVGESPGKRKHQNSGSSSSATTSAHAAPASLASSTSTTIHGISDNSDSGMEESNSSLKKKKRKPSGTRTREYVPAYRSGPYALILTLYRQSLRPDYKGYLIKTELAHAAQPLSDKSFTLPDAGSYYTAWSSMSTLLKKGLVSKVSSPARFSLTPEGFTLGERLEAAEKGGNDFITGGHRSSSGSCSQVTSSGSPSKAACEDCFHSNSCQVGNDVDLQNVPLSDALGCLDDDVCILSDEDDNEVQTHFSRIPSPSKTSRVHSLSPSSTESSPVPGKKFPSEVSPLKSSDNAFVTNTHSPNVSICVMDFEDFENSNDVPKLSRLPSLSPPPVSSLVDSDLNSPSKLSKHKPTTLSFNFPRNLDNDVIEIDDDCDDVNEDVPLLSSFAASKKTSIFSNMSSSQRTSSQSDEDELPDLDFDVPLSERLMAQGSVNSQLLSSCFNVNPQPTNNPVSVDCSAKNVNSNQPSSFNVNCDPPPNHHSSREKKVKMKDANPLPQKSFTSIVSKKTDSDQMSKQPQASAATSSTFQNTTQKPDHQAVPLEKPVPQFSLYPGTYDIVMCIDNREFYGSKSSSKTLLPDLMQSGVNCDLRLLHIGDILWIARECGDPNEDPSRAKRKELVLNYAIERKRMDDLVSSITGGRLKEQKFRLKHSGLSELIILIEEYGSIQNFSISEDRIKQSIVNSQILDGFKVKRCGSSKDAVRYLATMTRFIQRYFGNKTLHAAPHDYVQQTSLQISIRDKECYLMPFDVFNEASVKHKTLTVKEMFGKQLIQIPGVSLERACAITKVYPCLKILQKAYEDCTSEKARESLLSSVKCGSKERNLGIAISRMMYMLYKPTQSLS